MIDAEFSNQFVSLAQTFCTKILQGYTLDEEEHMAYEGSLRVVQQITKVTERELMEYEQTRWGNPKIQPDDDGYGGTELSPSTDE